jgi:hypothetical protein
VPPRSKERLIVAVRRTCLGRSAGGEGSRRTAGLCERRVRVGPKGERGHGLQGRLGARVLGEEQPRGAPWGLERRGRAPARRPGALERERVAAGLLLVRTDAV